MKNNIIEFLQSIAPHSATQADLIAYLDDMCGIKTTPRAIRKVINLIKSGGELPGLVSTTEGYRVADDNESFLAAVRRLDSQIESMRATRQALISQWEKRTGLIPVKDFELGTYELLHIDDIPPPPYEEGAECFSDWRTLTAWENRNHVADAAEFSLINKP